MKKNNYLILFSLLIIASCGLPKKYDKIVSVKQKTEEFPLDYKLLFPDELLDNWDKDYDLYYKFITPEVARTQASFSHVKNGVEYWTCFPSVLSHVQLDTSTRIKSINELKGDWRLIESRKILFIDSAVFSEEKIHRSSKLISKEKEIDGILSISDIGMKMFGKENGKFRRIYSKNYQLVNNRILMLYTLSKASSAISFVGIDEEGRLIQNSYFVQERKMKDKYITFEATVFQYIYTRASIGTSN